MDKHLAIVVVLLFSKITNTIQFNLFEWCLLFCYSTYEIKNIKKVGIKAFCKANFLSLFNQPLFIK